MRFLLLMTLTLIVSTVQAEAARVSPEHAKMMEEKWLQKHSQQQESAAETILKMVEPSHVCMINNTLFDKEQILVEVEGKSYYGCCAMCEARLKEDATSRIAIDPVSGNEVDKADAFIGADAEGAVYYFESEENLKSFTHDK